MTEIFKLNQRAELLDEKAEDYAFIIEVEIGIRYSFHEFKIIESKFKDSWGNSVINFNEWKVSNIYTENYFSRLKIYGLCTDPKGTSYRIMTGGRTVGESPKSAFYFFNWILDTIFKLSFCKSFEDSAKMQTILDKCNGVLVSPSYFPNCIYFNT